MTKIPSAPATFLLYGDTSTGKTTNWGFFAKWLFKQTGGKLIGGKAEGGLRTRLYCSDNGGWRGVQPLVDVGIVEVVDCRVLPHAYLWMDRTARGMVPIITGEVNGVLQGTWKTQTEGIGLFVFDSITGTAEIGLDDLTNKAVQKINIGGDGSYTFQSGDKDWGVETVGANNQSHYGAVQQRMTRMVGLLNSLSERTQSYVIATATARREQNDSRQTIMGPQVAGKALTPELPRLFTYTFHLVNLAAAVGEPEHKLFFVSHMDTTAGNATGLANRRLPLLSPRDAAIKSLPAFISPADMVEAYQMILKEEEKVKAGLLKEFA